MVGMQKKMLGTAEVAAIFRIAGRGVAFTTPLDLFSELDSLRWTPILV